MRLARFIALCGVSVTLLAASACSGTPEALSGAPMAANGVQMASIDALMQRARRNTGAKARMALVADMSATEKKLESLENPGDGRVPNYLRAAAILPGVAEPFARLFKTFIYGGTVAPELKLAMGLRIAQLNDSAYTAAYVQRLLHASERGKSLFTGLEGGTLTSLREPDRLALDYAESLTKDIRAVTDDDFRKVRGAYDDSQLVELTLVISFFNYFTRFANALNLPVEPWVLGSAPPPMSGKYEASVARVALLSDEEIAVISTTVAPAARDQLARTKTSGSVGFAFPNSDRAMYRVPALALAWHAFNSAVGKSSIGRDIKLQVSFAVSMANGCRYCTMHQVVGMRRLGVDPAKLLAMEKSDEALTPRERVAVKFARKLTETPGGLTDTDYDTLRTEFGEQGALEVLEQTCHFAFLNRFTDGLRLPSEDEAIRTYRETYGSDWKTR